MNNREVTRSKEAASFKDRRKRADIVTKMATILSLISWLSALVVWIMLDIAAPEKENMFTRMFSIEVRSYWNSSLLSIAFALLVASLCSCILAFFFNMLRKRRKTDKYKKSIIIAGIVTIVGIIFFVTQFGELLFAGNTQLIVGAYLFAR